MSSDQKMPKITYIAIHPVGEWAEFGFESERAREAFINGWCYALAGDDHYRFDYEQRQFELRETVFDLAGELCGHCGGVKPSDQSCACWDNNCE